jgi:2-amino-4-hydroxy-6-hydroxymethyldihydropteridine diphosphokinase
VLATSRWRGTKPVGGPAGQSEFLNGAALLGTSLTPQQLHAVLQQVEAAAGRTRESRWAPRTLDLDLLIYDDLVIDTPDLTLPHPRMSFRRFVLEPAAEIAPDVRHPTIGWTIQELRDHLQRGWDRTNPFSDPQYIAAVAGPIAAGKTKLAAAVADAIGGRFLAEAFTRNISEPPTGFRREFDRQFEAVMRRSDALKEAFGEGAHFRTISDFWIDQLACPAELALPSEQFDKYARFLSLAAAGFSASKPKLLVLLDVPPDISWQRIAERGDPNPPRIDWLARYRELLLKRVAEPGHGPVLRLDGTKLDEAKEELVAAIQAMQ